MRSREAVRIKAILTGPFFIVAGLVLLHGMFSMHLDVWQIKVAAPAAIVGGILLLWIGLRSKSPSREETVKGAAEATKDVAKAFLDVIN
jgi:small neutral amino acid transporter SnatA (MarC family)